MDHNYSNKFFVRLHGETKLFYSTDEDPSLRIESLAIIDLRGLLHKVKMKLTVTAFPRWLCNNLVYNHVQRAELSHDLIMTLASPAEGYLMLTRCVKVSVPFNLS